MASQPKITPAMRRVLAGAPASGPIKNVPIPIAIAMTRRGWGERRGDTHRNAPGSFPTTDFHLNVAGRAIALQMQENAKFNASYAATLKTVPEMLEDESLDQLIRNAQGLVFRLDEAGCPSGSARGYLAALLKYRDDVDAEATG